MGGDRVKLIPLRHLYHLPWPPSLNRQSVNRKMRTKTGKEYTGRMTSEDVKAYRRMVEVAVREGHRAPPRLSCRLDIAVLACPPDSYGGRWWDLDNYWKILLDSLKRAGVVEDDRLFDHEEIFRGSPVPGGRLLVSIFPFDPLVCFHRQEALGLSSLTVRDLLSDSKEPF